MGVNNIPPKICSYSCVYCQVGRTIRISAERQTFYNPENILREVRRKVDAVPRNEVDYVTFVPDGEPTLDLNLGKEISLLKMMKIPIAVLTNSSLLWRDDVKEDLMEADFVSLKVDSVNEESWKRINRPHADLRLDYVLDCITDFTDEFKGKIVSETMLIKGLDHKDGFKKTAEFLKNLKRLDKAYIAIPTRPPAEKWVEPAIEEDVNAAFQLFSERLGANNVECLTGYEGNAFAFTGKLEEDLLSIAAVHPMREEAVREFLKKANADWKIIEELMQEGKLGRLEFEGNMYYMRKLAE